MFAGQDHADPHNHAQDETDHETKPSRVLKGALAQIEHSGRFVFVHARSLSAVLRAASLENGNRNSGLFFR